MAESTNNQPPAKPRKKVYIPVITASLSFLGRHFSLAVLSGGVSVFIIVCIYAYRYFNGDTSIDFINYQFENMWAHTSNLGSWLNVQHLFNWLVTHIHDYWQSESVQQFTQSISDLGQKTTSQMSNIKEAYDKSIRPEKGIFFSAFRTTVEFLTSSLNVILVVSAIWFIKVLCIVNYLPVYLLSAGFGLANGWTQRKIDTYKGGLDFEDRLEFAYRKLRLCTVTVLFVYLSIPYGVAPLYVFVPSVIATGITVRFLAKLFKKYY